MADEQTPEKGPELDDVPQAAEAPPKEEAAPAPEIKEERSKIKPYEAFWDNVDKLATIDITSPIDIPGSGNVGEIEDFRGTISFDDFPSAGSSFTGQAKLIKGLHEGVPNGTLVLHPSGILKALSNVAVEYAQRGDSKTALSRSIQEKLPAIFQKVFSAIKEKSSPKLHWSKGNDAFKEKENVVHFILDDSIDKELGVNLFASFDAVRKDLEGIARTTLLTPVEKRQKSPILRERQNIRDFVKNTIPKDKFKLVNHKMLATLRMDEIESLGGKELVDVISKTAPVGANEYLEQADATDFWYRYYPDQNVVIFENKEMTNRKIMEDIKGIWKRYGGGTPQDLFKAISDDREVGVTSVVKWFTDLVNMLTPDLVSKVAPILGVNEKEGLKKVAYPDQQWAGPSLDQVGGLVGDAQAKWASELAGNLAAKFDYISFPTLAGGPSDLKKLATLPLTDEQRARVEKYTAKATTLLSVLLAAYPTHDVDPESGQVTGYVRPDSEEVRMMAENALLELVDETPSTMPDEEFMNELKHKLHGVVKQVQRHPHSAWPSRQTSPEDALAREQVPMDVALDEAPMNKIALMHEDDAVQVMQGHPTVDSKYQGLMGKIKDVKGDIFMCPKHGPEPFIRYLVELEDGELRWFRGDELQNVASVN